MEIFGFEFYGFKFILLNVFAFVSFIALFWGLSKLTTRRAVEYREKKQHQENNKNQLIFDVKNALAEDLR